VCLKDNFFRGDEDPVAQQHLQLHGQSLCNIEKPLDLRRGSVVQNHKVITQEDNNRKHLTDVFFCNRVREISLRRRS